MEKEFIFFQVAHVRAERNALADGTNEANEWIVKMNCSFQDEEFLFMVMEFCQGGDMMTWLMHKEVFTEEEAKFYIAELILAVDAVHHLEYVHRYDCKL